MNEDQITQASDDALAVSIDGGQQDGELQTAQNGTEGQQQAAAAGEHAEGDGTSGAGEGQQQDGGTGTDGQQGDDSEERKAHNAEMARQRVEEQRRIRAASEAITSERISEAEAAVEEAGEDEVRRRIAELELRDARRESAEAQRQIEHTHTVMRNSVSQAVNTIDLFNSTKNPETASVALDDAMQELVPYLETRVVAEHDASGNVVAEYEVITGCKVDVLEHLKAFAERAQRYMELGEKKGQATINSMQVRANDEGASGAVSGAGADSGKKFEDLSADEQRKILRDKGYEI